MATLTVEGAAFSFKARSTQRSEVLAQCEQSGSSRAVTEIPLPLRWVQAWDGELDLESMALEDQLGVVKVADFLVADTRPAARALCATLMRKHADAPHAWRLLKEESSHIRDTVLSHHPLMNTFAPFASILPQLPKCLGLRAVRSSVRSRAALDIDASSASVAKELPALLPALTDLRSIVVAADVSKANPYNDTCASSQPCARGWAPLTVKALQTLTQLDTVEIRFPLVHRERGRDDAGFTASSDEDKSALAVLIAIAACTQLTAVRLNCCAIEWQMLEQALPAVLQALSGLRSLSLEGGGACVEAGVARVDDKAGHVAFMPCGPDLAAIRALAALTYLRVANWWRTHSGLHSFCAAMRTLRELRAVELPNGGVLGRAHPELAALKFNEPSPASEHMVPVMLQEHANHHAGWRHLTRLNVHGCLNAPQSVAPALDALTNLRRVDASQRMRPSVEARGVVNLNLAVMGKLHALEYLDLSGWFIEFNVSQKHASSWTGLSRLRTLRLAGCTGGGTSAFIAAVGPGLTSLVQLDLLRVAIDDSQKSADNFASALSALPQLQALAISGGSNCEEKWVRTVGKAMTRARALRGLEIALLEPDIEALISMADYMKAATQVHSLTLVLPMPDADGSIMQTLEALQGGDTLTSLTFKHDARGMSVSMIDHNIFASEFAQYMALLFAMAPSLQRFDLSLGALEAEDLKGVVAGLKRYWGGKVRQCSDGAFARPDVAGKAPLVIEKL